MKKLTSTLFALAFAFTVTAQDMLPIIPYPQEVTIANGSVALSAADNITYTTDENLKKEEYKLDITESGITITSSTESGKFNALQSLEQMKLASTDGTLPLCSIHDYPLLEYRSFMLDCSRHFFTKEAVKRILKVMSLYKINHFHWHLNDDQGWRVEIPEYPRLTTVGSIRKGSLTLKDSPTFFYDDTEYGRGCYYTLDDLREVVAYADSLNIEIIPEYDLPGHNVAAIAAYPNLSCDSTRTYEVRIAEGISTDVLNVGDDRVIDFLKCVLGHLAEIFPSKYMHLGGDECPTTVWETNAMCQKRIQDEGLSSVNDLQPWLLEKLGSWLRDTYGKQVVAWDELVANWKESYTIKPIIMCYRSGQYSAQAVSAAKMGLKSIMTPTFPCYFDQMQCSTTQAEFDEIYQGGYGATSVNNLESVYSFDPLSSYTSEGLTDYCWGTQGSLWTEACVTEAEMQYQFLPRMLAVAENGWLPASKKDWTGFKSRLQQHAHILDTLGYTYAKHYITDTRTTFQKTQDETRRLISATEAGKVGYVSQEAKDALEKALDESTDNATLKTAISAYKASDIAMPADSAIYQIRSASLYYLQRYLGSSLYVDGEQYKIHFTPQTEPEELWRCQLVEDGKYIFHSLLNGKPLLVNNDSIITVLRSTTKNKKYDYDPGVLLLQNGTKYLYANATGIVTDNTQKTLDYPSSWRLVEIQDYTTWSKSLKVKCEREIENWKPNTYGSHTEEAMTYLQKAVVDVIEARLQDSTPVTLEEYEAFVAAYNIYLNMPLTSFLDTIDENCYYYIQNGYFTSAYAKAANTNKSCTLTSGSAPTTDNTYRWRFTKQDGRVKVINKISDRVVYTSSSSNGGSINLTGSLTLSAAKYTWLLEEVNTDTGISGITIQDKTNTYSWYCNPNANVNVILRPKDYGASIWNFIKIADDPTPVSDIIATPATVKTGIFDLQGRRYSSLPSTPGIYIMDGKKVSVR